MKDERIDNYVLGRMPEDDRRAFEQELNGNAELRDDVALHGDIVRAVRMKGLKAYLQQVERDIQQKEHRFRKRAIVVRFGFYAAIAACLAVGIFIDAEYSGQCRNVGRGIVLSEFGVRGGSSIDIIYEKIQGNDFRAALSLIEEAQSIQYSLSNPDAIAQYRAEQQVLEWYKAVTYMRMGKWIKARRVLKRIAASDSHYKTQAQSVLEQL